MQAPNPGDILLGKYRVEAIIGVGGMGRVVKASHMYLQQPVAIKILLPEMADSQSTVARFLREAQATVRLRSEHIARVMDVGTMPDGAPFMVMEFLEGNDLNQILRHHGPQEPSAVVDLIMQACEGMAEAHAHGIIHRDIKPSNFFITRRPDGSSLLKILDFGISKTPAEVTELTGAQTVIGTPTYMAPEQMVSARSTDHRSDIWSIGVVMYQLLAGRPPFEAETYAQLVLKVGTAAPAPLHIALPPGLQDIVLRCLEKDPNRRLQTVGELARMLAPYASNPLSAQQAAERASRILTSRGAHRGALLPGAGGGLSLTGPAVTPRSWNNDGSSVSGSAGQLGTKNVRRPSRAYVIGGVAALCIAAGIGGFFVATSLRGGDDGKQVTPAAAGAPVIKTMSVEPAKPAPAIVTPAPTPTAPTPTPTTPTPTAPTLPTVPTVVDKHDDKAEAKTPAKEATKAERPTPAKPTKSTTTKRSTATTKKPTKPTKKPTKPATADDDLFDDRE